MTKHGARLIHGVIVLLCAAQASAHPLGNFTVNHFARIETQTDRVRLHYVVDYAELAAFTELQNLDANRDGNYAQTEKQAWLAQQLPHWLGGVRLTANGQPLGWRVVRQALTLVPGAVNLFTLRIEADLEAPLSREINAAPTQFTLTDTNHHDRQGWHELVLKPAPGVLIFDSTAYGNAVTDELKAYPEDRAPLAERSAVWSAARDLPAGAKPLLNRDGQPTPQPRQPFKRVAWVACLVGAALLGLLWQRRRRREPPAQPD